MTRTKERTARILSLLDQGHQPVAIAVALNLSTDTVYAALRKERPDRKRAPRRRTSDVPAKARALVAAGIGVPRVAELLGVSTKYVYQILAGRYGGVPRS